MAVVCARIFFLLIFKSSIPLFLLLTKNVGFSFWHESWSLQGTELTVNRQDAVCKLVKSPVETHILKAPCIWPKTAIKTSLESAMISIRPDLEHLNITFKCAIPNLEHCHILNKRNTNVHVSVPIVWRGLAEVAPSSHSANLPPVFYLAQQKYHYSQREEQDNELCIFSCNIAHNDQV